MAKVINEPIPKTTDVSENKITDVISKFNLKAFDNRS